MKYTINEVDHCSLKLIFGDGSWANVQIKTDTSLEDLDKIAGTFTNEYAKARPTNPLVQAGMQRETADPTPPVVQPAVETGPDRFTIDLGAAVDYISSFTLFTMAEQLAAGGNTELRDLLYVRSQAVLDDPEFDYDTLITKLNDTL